jgi:hypothetical protein
MKKLKKIKITVFAFTAILIQVTSNAQSKNNYLIEGLKNTKIYKESLFNNFSHVEKYKPKNIKSKLMPEFMIKFESQVGISIRPTLVNSKDYGEIINSEFYIDATANKNFLQIGEHDFDGDMKAEIVACFGVKGTESICSVYKFFEPKTLDQANRKENWKKIGDFENSYHDPKYFAFVEKDKIHFPFGSQGATSVYQLKGDNFIELK